MNKINAKELASTHENGGMYILDVSIRPIRLLVWMYAMSGLEQVRKNNLENQLDESKVYGGYFKSAGDTIKMSGPLDEDRRLKEPREKLFQAAVITEEIYTI